MSKVAFVVAAIFAVSAALADSNAFKAPAPQQPAKTQPAAGGQSGGAKPSVAGGAAQERLTPAAMIAIGVAAVVVVASMSSDSPGGPSAPAQH